MSVVSVIISKTCTVHASDSFITARQPDGSYKRIEAECSKIVPVRHWHGAMGYWGFAGTVNSSKPPKLDWSTLKWLKGWAQQATALTSPEAFATELARALTKELSKISLSNSTESGVGIHFTAYERINDYWVPELFLITNWSDSSYSALRANGIEVTRETFHAISDEAPDQKHGEANYRLQVHRFLQEGKILAYNNGDPALYNSAANGLFSLFKQLASRGALASPDAVQTWTSLARRPIEIVSKSQLDFCLPDQRLVGGKPHDLAVTPGGAYTSTTGDSP